MPAVIYSEQTRFTLCYGVTLTATAEGATLHAPPRTVELTELAEPQVRALSTLARGPRTVAEIAAEAGGADVAPLLDRLADGGWLAATVRDAGRDLYTIRPFERPVPRPEHSLPSWSATLSKFAVLHRDGGGFVLEHPRSWCSLRIHDPRLLALLDGLGSADSDLPIAVKTQFADDLHWGGFLVADGWAEENEPGARDWSAADLWLHRLAMRHGPGRAGADDPARAAAARRPAYLGETVALPAPADAVDAAAGAPLTIERLGDMLYRAARGQAAQTACGAPATGDSPIEVYPVVREVAGLAPGMYHYDSAGHRLRPVAPADSPSVRRMLASSADAYAAAVGAAAGEPQALIVFGARSGLLSGDAAPGGYAAVLRQTGALTQMLALAGAALGVGVCAQSFTEAAAFASATGNDELEECALGAIAVGMSGRR
ncbi:MAG TPA: nitroreductase family protein [Nocardia sp.]|nr:nitroreductase family protein [Nocardia sp.]